MLEPQVRPRCSARQCSVGRSPTDRGRARPSARAERVRAVRFRRSLNLTAESLLHHAEGGFLSTRCASAGASSRSLLRALCEGSLICLPPRRKADPTASKSRLSQSPVQHSPWCCASVAHLSGDCCLITGHPAGGPPSRAAAELCRSYRSGGFHPLRSSRMIGSALRPAPYHRR